MIGVGSGPSPLRIAVIGAGGRMGAELLRAIGESDDLVLAASVTRKGDEHRRNEPRGSEPAVDAERGGPGDLPGRELVTRPVVGALGPGVTSSVVGSLDALDPTAYDVAVEFTRADALVKLAPQLTALGKPWISGTTGLDPAGRAALADAAKKIPVLWAPNMSLGVTLLLRLLDQAARFLPANWEMELVETHHAAKRDAPSGTALALAQKWKAVRGGDIRNGREGLAGPRPAGEIGIHAVRLPEGVGEHRVLLGGRGEGIEIMHRATDRAAFAKGALEAARWLSGQQKAGLYTLEDWAEDRLREIPR